MSKRGRLWRRSSKELMDFYGRGNTPHPSTTARVLPWPLVGPGRVVDGRLW